MSDAIESEFMETFDDEGNPLGLQARSLIHASGQWHRCVNVIIIHPDGRMLIQQRSRSKDVCPGAWDLSVAEHLKPGETFEGAAHRGLEEELSLSGVDLISVGIELRQKLEIREHGIRDFELQTLFIGVSTDTPVADSKEIAGTRYATAEEIRELRASAPVMLTPWFRAWLDAVSEETFWPSPFDLVSRTSVERKRS